MAAIVGVPMVLSTGADAALSGTASHTVGSSWLPAALTGTGVKVAMVAAVIAAGGLVYTLSTRAGAPAPKPAAALSLGALAPAPAQERPDTPQMAARQSPSATPTNSDAENALDGSRSGQEAVDAKNPVDTPPLAMTETTVTGTVLDRNTLQPIAGVRVGFDRNRTCVTDSDGRFKLVRQDSQEEVSVVASAPEYATEQIALRVEIGGRHEIQLKMEPGLTLVGAVVDPNHNPIENARVYVHVPGHVSYPLATTNAQGQFMIEGLHPERSAVFFHAEHAGYFAEAPLPFASLNRAPLGEEIVQEIILTPGSRHEVPEMPSAPAGPEVVVPAPAGRIYGQVVDADTGRAIPCFRVVMKDRVPLAWAWNGYTFASEQGHFDTGTLNLIPGQERSVTVHAEGYDPVTLDAMPVQPASQSPDRIVIRLRPNERRSTIYAGRVVDMQGRGIRGAEVGFRLDDLKDGGIGFSRVLTDVSGMYMISSIDPCEHIFFVRGPGYASRYGLMSELLLATPGVFADVALPPPGTITGYAWDEFAQGIAHACVTCGPVVRSEEQAKRTAPLWDVLWPQTQTDEYGHYELMGLPIGEVDVSVRCQDNRRIAPKTVTVRSGEAIELNFGERGGLVISGVVTDGENPLAGVEVELKTIDGGLDQCSRTDAAGRFRFIHIPAGEYVFAAIRPRDPGDIQPLDPNDTSHLLYEVMDIGNDLNLLVDYQAGSIRK